MTVCQRSKKTFIRNIARNIYPLLANNRHRSAVDTVLSVSRGSWRFLCFPSRVNATAPPLRSSEGVCAEMKTLPPSVVRGWLRVKEASVYSGYSERSIRYFLKEGLRHVRPSSRKILIKREWMDEFLEKFEVREDRVHKVVDEVMRGF